MEAVYTDVDRVSLFDTGEGYAASFRGAPGENATEDPGATGKATVQVTDATVRAKGADVATRHEDGGVTTEIHFPDAAGVVLLDRDRRRLRCGTRDEFDDMDQHYIRHHAPTRAD